jgi:hypothetical protein
MFDQGYSSAFETELFDSQASSLKNARADLYSEGEISGSSTVIHFTILASVYSVISECVSGIESITNTLIKSCNGFKERGRTKILLISLRRED